MISDIIASLKKRLTDSGQAIAPMLRNIGSSVSQANNNLGQFYKGFAITPQKVQSYTDFASRVTPFIPFAPKITTPQQAAQNYKNIGQGYQVARKIPLIGGGIIQPVENAAKDYWKYQTSTAPLLSRQGVGEYGKAMGSSLNAALALQGGKNLITGGLKSAAANLGITAGLGGGLNKLAGGSFLEGAKQGLNAAPTIQGIAHFTNPAIQKGANLIASRIARPAVSNIAGRVASGLGNIPEGMVMRQSLGGGKYTPQDAAMDFVAGAALQPPTAKLKVKGAYEGPLIKEDRKAIQDVFSRFKSGWQVDGKISLDQYAKDLDFVKNVMKEQYGMSEREMKQIGDGGIINELYKIARSDTREARGMEGISMGIAGKQDLTQEQVDSNKKLPDILFATTKAEAEGKGPVRNKINPDGLPWETSEYKAQLKAQEALKPNTTLKIGEEAQTAAEANTIMGNNGNGGINGLANDTRDAFQGWVNNRRATKVEGLLKNREFVDLDKKGLQGIFDYQSGNQSGGYTEVKAYFDSKRQEVIDAGIPTRYKQDYLPQLWVNTKEEIQKVFGNKLGMKPSFTMASLIKDYQEGIAGGLKPKFGTIGQLAGWYERTANKSLADKQFFDYLAKEGMIMSQGKAPSDWVTLSPDRFPKIKVNIGDNQYAGSYKAPPEMAKLINNYLNSADEGIIANIANFTSRAKNIALSFGVPGTGINAHGVNILARHTLFGTGGNPITRFMTGAKYMINPGAAETALNETLATAPKAVKSGLTLSAEDHNGILGEVETLAQSLGKKWNEAFEIPLFNKMIPSLKLSSYNELVKGGMTEKDAAVMVNNVYGGINWEQMGRDRNTQNLLRSIFLAPDWAETSLRLGGNLIKSFGTSGKVASRYRTMTATLLGSIVAANIANKLTSGHYMYENDPGHTFEIQIGYTQDGQRRYLKPYGTAIDFVRLPVDAILGLLKGDPSPIFRSISNRLAMPLSAATHLATNTDYLGNSLYGRDKYGNDIPAGEAMMGISSEMASAVGFPSVLKNVGDVVSGKQGVEQGVLQGLELPFRYSGGAYSAAQKQLQPLAKQQGLQGKALYDLNASLKGQKKFSENQMGAIQSSGLQGVLDTRAGRSTDTEIKKQLTETGQNMIESGGKIYILQPDGKINTIDLSFQPKMPALTNNAELDKKLISKYNTEISAKMKDVVALYEANKISPEQAEQELSKLITMKSKFAKGKKARIITTRARKVSFKKTKLRKIAKIKFKNPKVAKIKFKKSKASVRLMIKNLKNIT